MTARKRAPTAGAEALYRSLRQLSRRLRAREMNAVCDLGISVRECHALELLADEPLSLNGLAAPLGLDKSTVSRLVQHLVDEKLVARKADQSDSRAIVLTLTAKGRKVYEAALRESLACYRKMLENIPARDRDSMVDALQLAARLIDDL